MIRLEKNERPCNKSAALFNRSVIGFQAQITFTISGHWSETPDNGRWALLGCSCLFQLNLTGQPYVPIIFAIKL